MAKKQLSEYVETGEKGHKGKWVKRNWNGGNRPISELIAWCMNNVNNRCSKLRIEQNYNVLATITYGDDGKTVVTLDSGVMDYLLQRRIVRRRDARIDAIAENGIETGGDNSAKCKKCRAIIRESIEKIIND